MVVGGDVARYDRRSGGRMRGWWTLIAAGVGCGGPSSSPPETIVEPSADTGEVTHGASVPDRPLCAERVAPPVIAADLVAWALSVRATDNRFFGEATWLELEALGDDLGPDAVAVPRGIERGWNRMRMGDIEGALTDLEAAVARAEVAGSPWRGRARQVAATAWMRRAELDNCLTDGTGAACLVPFSEEALHARTEGMTRASALLLAFLSEDDPTAVLPRWLLNVAHMALGDWPDAVPEVWRVPTEALEPEAEVPPWHNVAPGTLLALDPTISGDVALDDFDGDGQLDLLLSNFEPDRGMRLFLNRGDGTFCDASHASGVSAIPGVLGFSQADYDNDGDLDVFAPRAAWYNGQGHIRASLLRNDGAGRFEDVAVQAGVAEPVGPSQVAAWADVDGDGWLDVFVCREVDDAAPGGVAPSSLYMNQRDGTFLDVAAAVGMGGFGFCKGATWGDVDDDGDPDLYVSLLTGDNRLLRNTPAGFEDVTRISGVQAPAEGFSTWFFDHDQDGDLDLFAAAYTASYSGGAVLSDAYGRSAEGYVRGLLGVPVAASTAHLYENNGSTFIDRTEAAGLDDVHATMGASFGDLNADGFPDLYLGTGAPEFDALEPNVAYLNTEGGRRFLDVTAAAHLGHLQKGHGVSFGDLDEDGDEDLVEEMGGAFRGDAFPDTLFINPSQPPVAVTLRLVGTTSNRSAIGARVRIVTDARTFHHLVGGTGSFGANSLQVEAALGGATRIERVEIDWPGAWSGPLADASGTEVVTGVEPGHVVTIRQGEGVIAARPYARLDLEAAHAEHDGAATP